MSSMLRNVFATGRVLASRAKLSFATAQAAPQKSLLARPTRLILAAPVRTSYQCQTFSTSSALRGSWGLGLFQSDHSLDMTDTFNEKFFRCCNYCTPLPLRKTIEQEYQSLHFPSDRALVRADFDDGMLKYLQRTGKIYGPVGELYLAALAMMNGARITQLWKSQLEDYLFKQSSDLNEQGFYFEGQKELAKALREYPNDGTYWEFGSLGLIHTMSVKGAVATDPEGEVAKEYEKHLKSVPGEPAEMDPSTLPKNFPVLEDDNGKWDITLSKTDKSGVIRSYRVRVLKAENPTVPKRYFYRVDWGPGVDQWMLKTSFWDDQPQEQFVQRIKSRLTARRGWKLDADSRDRFDEFSNYVKTAKAEQRAKSLAIAKQRENERVAKKQQEQEVPRTEADGPEIPSPDNLQA